MTSYQDQHAPIKFMTGVSLNIIMGSTLRTAAILSIFRRGKWLTQKKTEGIDCCLKQKKKKPLLWVLHMFLVTPRTTNTSDIIVP